VKQIELSAGTTEYIPGLAGRHNGGTENVRPIVHDLHDQNTSASTTAPDSAVGRHRDERQHGKDSS